MSTESRALGRALIAVFIVGVTWSCSDAASRLGVPESAPLSETLTPSLRVYHNPYAAVNWVADQRLLAQHHDHTGDDASGLAAYDSAGYNAVSYMNYSGLASASYAWSQRHWPVTDWQPSGFEKKLKHVRFFIPNGEEVGYWHLTSPFMTKYVAKTEAGYSYPAGTIMYGGSGLSSAQGTQSAINAVLQGGGFPIVAHPWTSWSDYKLLSGYKGVEIYNAYVEQKFADGSDAYFTPDRNRVMQSVWDQMLMRDQTIVGIAVNDHYGPDNTQKIVGPRVRDSGKILVLSKAATYAAYVEAFTKGALFAIQDMGAVKGSYPIVNSISIDTVAISLDVTGADATVEWIANGDVFATGMSLRMGAIPATALYVRAVISNPQGSHVFTQAFTIRSRGDANGDGLIDAVDRGICGRVRLLSDTDPDHIAACVNP